jgi:hypothetical protein
MKVKKHTTVLKKIVELDINPIREYLKNNQCKKLSVNTLRKLLTIKRAKVLYYCQNSNNIRKVTPWEVGTCKRDVNVFAYKE